MGHLGWMPIKLDGRNMGTGSSGATSSFAQPFIKLIEVSLYS